MVPTDAIRYAGKRIGLGMVRNAVMGKLGEDLFSTPDEQTQKEENEYTRRIAVLLQRSQKSNQGQPAAEKETKVLSVPQ
jgi:hypothetical protein